MDPMWTPYIQSPEKDDWRGIEDVVIRKRVQNRLAQRAHRKKFGRKPEKTKRAHGPLSSEESTCSTSDKRAFPSQEELPHPRGKSDGKDTSTEANVLNNFDFPETNGLDYPSVFLDEYFPSDLVLSPTSPRTGSIQTTNSPFQTQNNLVPSYNATISNLDTISYPSPKIDTHFILLHATSTLSALLTNAALLSIDCSTRLEPGTIIMKIWLNELSPAPPSLLPLPLQTIIAHSPYVDLIPIPALRERLLLAQHIIDCYEIWHDISVDVKVWGSNPWEEGAWEIGEWFAVKWWFLMGDEVLRGTNMWRNVRGESRLGMERIKSRFAGGAALVDGSRPGEGSIV